jgi:hypothetical protein
MFAQTWSSSPATASMHCCWSFGSGSCAQQLLSVVQFADVVVAMSGGAGVGLGVAMSDGGGGAGDGGVGLGGGDCDGGDCDGAGDCEFPPEPVC